MVTSRGSSMPTTPHSLLSSLPPQASAWTTDETQTWLSLQNWIPPSIVTAMVAERVDGQTLLSLTASDLVGYGMAAAKAGQVVRHIQELEPGRVRHNPAAGASPRSQHNPTALLGTGPTPLSFDSPAPALPYTSIAAPPSAFIPSLVPPMLGAPPGGYQTPTSIEAALELAPINRIVTPRSTRGGGMGWGSPQKWSPQPVKYASVRRYGEDENDASTGAVAVRSPLGSARTLLGESSVATPSAPPRTSSKHKTGDPRLLASKMSDKQLAETKARKLRDAHERNAAAEEERRQEAVRVASAKALTPSQRKLRAAFEFINVSGTGVMKEAELEDVLSMLHPEFGSERLYELQVAILEECDKDKSGTISLEEFVNSVYAQDLAVPAEQAQKRAERYEKLSKAFQFVDRNGSGKIDYLELHDLMNLVFPRLSDLARDRYYQAIVAECDANKNGLIDMGEFLNSKYANQLARPMELEERQAQRRAKLEEAFSKVDVDGSGQIESTELLTLLRIVLPDATDASIKLYAEVILVECDADNSGSISIAEFLASPHANLLGDVGYEGPSGEDGLASHDETSAAHLIARVDRVRESRRDQIKSTSPNIMLTSMGTLEEVNDNSLRSGGATSPTGRSTGTPTGTRSPAPRHLNTVEQEQTRIAREKVLAAQEMLIGTAKGNLGFFQGPLERERRYTAMTNLFHKWDESSDVSVKGSGFIEYNELRTVLQRFFNWTDAEAAESSDTILRQMDANADGRLDWNEFVQFITRVTDTATAQQFDELLAYVHECVGEVSEEAEFERRDKLLADLFKFWDNDESGFIDRKELTTVLQQYNKNNQANPPPNSPTSPTKGGMSPSYASANTSKDPSTAQLVDLAMGSADTSGDGKLDATEFCKFMQGLSFRFAPEDFDFMLYRMRRAVEHVHTMLHANRASMQYKAVMQKHLATKDFIEMVETNSACTPLILHGTSFDPSRAIEQCAEAQGRVVEPAMVIHDKGERAVLERVKRCMLKGHWVYAVLNERYPADWFLRQVGVELQTKSRVVSQHFRLWIFAPLEHVQTFPAILTTGAVIKNLDEVQAPSSNRPAAVVRFMGK